MRLGGGARGFVVAQPDDRNSAVWESARRWLNAEQAAQVAVVTPTSPMTYYGVVVIVAPGRQYRFIHHNGSSGTYLPVKE
jgi:hypothetical protein